MLYIFGGLPGTGKSTLAAALAQRTHTAYLRIDTIEQALRDASLSVEGPTGYIVGYKVASENLRLGMSVIVDSVNPLNITRQAWRDVAVQNEVPYVEIEIICSSQEEHRRRIESRQSNIPGLKVPTWKEVVEHEYQPWPTAQVVLDTAGQMAPESISHLFKAVANWRSQSQL